MNFKNVNVLIIGYGISGKAAANFLSSKKAAVYIYDDNLSDFSPYKSYNGDLRYGYTITSPSIDYDHKILAKTRSEGSVILSELELAYLINKEKGYGNKIIGITGTNGKTTTTKMIDDIFKADGIESCAVGNIGYPFINKAEDDFTAVCELSSFQLLNMKFFHLDYALLLNIDSDHLDHHKSLEEYIAAKMNILNLQNDSDIAILNFDDKTAGKLGSKCAGKIYYFSYYPFKENGTYIENNNIYFRREGREPEKICNVSELNIPLKHNLMNALAAICVCKLMNAGNPAIIKALSKYQYEAYRLQPAGVINNIKIFNDSKSTNIHSTESAVNSVEGNTILILGGHNKYLDYSDFFKNIDKKIKYILCCGDNSLDIYMSAIGNGFNDIFILETYKDCLEWAFSNSEGIENILFSPSTSSFDRFKNYEQRGEYFNEVVNEFKASQKK